MPKSLTKEQAFQKCEADGMFIPQSEAGIDKVGAMLKIVEEDLETINDLKKKDRWNTLYKLNYDVMRTLTEALLSFDNVKSLNHQCVFSYLCVKHPELELDWGFFEKIRTKRNGIHYYGASVGKDDWREVELQFSLYIRLLRDEINNRLNAKK